MADEHVRSSVSRASLNRDIACDSDESCVKPPQMPFRNLCLPHSAFFFRWSLYLVSIPGEVIHEWSNAGGGGVNW